MNRVIGGEFEISLQNISKKYSTLPKYFEHGYFYSSGRAALYHILSLVKKIGKKNILLPEYLCESVVEAVKLASVSFKFYKISEDYLDKYRFI